MAFVSDASNGCFWQHGTNRALELAKVRSQVHHHESEAASTLKALRFARDQTADRLAGSLTGQLTWEIDLGHGGGIDHLRDREAHGDIGFDRGFEKTG